MIISHLPDGPTAHFKLSSVKLGKDIKVMQFLLIIHHHARCFCLLYLSSDIQHKQNIIKNMKFLEKYLKFAVW